MKKKILITILSFLTSPVVFSQSISYKHLYMIATAQYLSEANDSIKRWNYRLIESKEEDYLGNKSLIYGWGSYDNPQLNRPWAVINIQLMGYIKFVTWGFSSSKAYQQIYGVVNKSGGWKKKSEDITNEGFELTYEGNNGCCIFLSENKDGWYKVTYSYFNKERFIEDHPVPADWDNGLLDK